MAPSSQSPAVAATKGGSRIESLLSEAAKLAKFTNKEWRATASSVDKLRYRMDALLEAFADLHQPCGHQIPVRTCAQCRMDREVKLAHKALRETAASTEVK